MNAIDNVQLPRLLRLNSSKNGLVEVKRLNPIKLSSEINADPISHAEMTLTEEETEVQLHDFVEIFGQNGSLGIFRVASIDYAFTKQQQVRLNHALDTLYDVSMALNTNISGNIASVLSAICAAQTTRFWSVGTVQDSGSYEKEDGGNALDILKEIAEREDEYYLTYDFSTFPWKINLLKKNAEVLSEFRLSRNVEDIQVTYDDKDLCTRLYLEVESAASGDEGGTDKNYEVYNDAAAQEVWGVISKTETVQAEAVNKQQWVQKYFDMHHNPSIQISISGLELNRLTGETIDQMHLSRICRVVMPEYGAPILERIVSISYPDLLRQPTRVRVALANKRKLASDRVKEMNSRQNSLEKSEKKTKEKAEKTEKQAEKNKKAISDNKTSLIEQDKIITDQGEVLRKAGIEIDPSGVFMFAKREGALGSEMASIDVRADQITSRVEKNRSDADKGFSEIKQRADSIEMDVVNLSQDTASHFEITDNAINANSQNINLNAENIRANATNIAANAQNIRVNAGRIDTNAGMISNHATLIQTNAFAIQTNATAIQTNADLIQTNAKNIQVNAGSIDVNAKKINIIAEDYVTINKLNTEISNMTAAFASSIRTTSLTATSAETSHLNVSGAANVGSLSVANTGYTNHTLSVDGKIVANFLGTGDVNFDRAKAKKEGEDSVKLSSAGWISGQNVVSATNGQKYTVKLPGFSGSAGAFNAQHKCSVTFSTPSVNMPLKTVEVDATSVYNEGKKAGTDGVTLSSAGWISGQNVVKASNGKSYTVKLPGFSASAGAFNSSNKCTVTFSTPSVNTPLKTIDVDASGVYTNGKNSVTVSDITTSQTYSSVNYNTTVSITAKASNGKTKTSSITVSGAAAYNAGYSAGSSAGYSSGYNEGKSDGYTSGFNEGKNEGYTEGYNDANGAYSLIGTLYTVGERSTNTHYLKTGDTYTSIGTGWTKVHDTYYNCYRKR